MSLTGERGGGREGEETKGLYEGGKLGGASRKGKPEQDSV
jgi:hypothetical protein